MMSENKVIRLKAEKLLNEWVKAWGCTNKKVTYSNFYAKESRIRMNLEAFAYFCVQHEKLAVKKVKQSVIL